MQRVRIHICGAVQGVGFRPFVFNLAEELTLKGWVLNSSQGIVIEAEGSQESLNAFLIRLKKDKPPRGMIQSFQYAFLEIKGYDSFQIKESDAAKEKTVFVLPDIATCPDCLQEIFDPHDRRYLYPFTNCTHCGPRYSVIEGLPYDRALTSMKKFQMCPDCQKEYEDPSHRRFHAQPNACPVCGPQCELWDAEGKVLLKEHAAILEAVKRIEEGQIVAVKGLGGFHFMVDARNDKAVRRLRERKYREEKPLALMFPSLEGIEKVCHVSEKEKFLLLSPEAPIVLLEKKIEENKIPFIAKSVAPQNPFLGVMLPYTPLHHILLKNLGFPLVATSGNLSDDTICTNETDALSRLKDISDVLLVHNRPIVHHVDDSIVRIISGRPSVLRRARGYAPMPITVKERRPPILAVGGHLKNTVAISVGPHVFISQHIGDLETKQSFVTFKKTIQALENLYALEPQAIVCDAHPGYLSTQFAQEQKQEVMATQHHHAHIVSCMAENQIEGDVLGVSWDGTGYGENNTIWGGEFLQANLSDFQRIGHFRTFALPGGEKAVKEPRRSAFGILYEIFGRELMLLENISTLNAFEEEDKKVLIQMFEKKINVYRTSSVGRIFDAVSSLLGLHQIVRFEGQAAMALEFALASEGLKESYSFNLVQEESGYIIDWEKMVREIIEDLRLGENVATISGKFHNALVESVVVMAQETKNKRVVLSGGCFQNKYLIEKVIKRLTEEGFRPYWHQNVPPNDGGISLGQAIIGGQRLKKRRKLCV